MKIYLIRHGQSVTNRDKLHAGWMQVPLSDEGVLQAKQVGAFLKSLKFDKIYSSDLLRAKQTLEYALGVCEYEESAAIRELNVGKLEGKSAKECVEIYGDFYVQTKARKDYTPFGGENEENIIERARKFYSTLSEKEYESVAIFTHEGFIRATLECALGCYVKPGSVNFKNCIVSLFELNQNELKLIAWNMDN